MKKRVLAAFMCALLAVSMAAGCGKKEEASDANVVDMIKEEAPEEEIVEESEEEEVEEENHDGQYRSEITNEWIDESLRDQRPIAAMVDNELTALPHYGLSKADVVYELMNSTKNGRITRLMAIVKDWGSIEQLGSIRSVRPTNIMLAEEWNAVLCHDGGPFYIDPYLASDYSANFSGGFSRVNNGKAREFTEYIMAGDLDKKFADSKYTTEYNDYYEGPHYQFAEEEQDLSDVSGAIDATEIKLPFEHNKSTLKYNEETQTYDYYDYGDLHVDPGNDNAPLTFKNVLIQNCTFHQYDENGYLIYNCIDNGREGYYITNGKAIPITWIKVSENGQTKYLDENGEEIKLNTGKTYVTLVPDDSWNQMSIK